MIRLEGLRKQFGATPALAGVSLAVNAGELFAYLGPNGSGKTTTVRIATGLTRPDAGRVRVGGHDVVGDALAARMSCGLASQHLSLDNDLTVRENLDIHGRLFRMPGTSRRQRIAEQLGCLELEDKADALIRTLSGGQKRRVMLARALMHRPRVLFLDEPTVGLDPAIRRRLWGHIKQIQKEGTTVFLTTHYIEEAEFLADRVAFLDAGALVCLDSPQGLVARVGQWAVDELDRGEIATRFFVSKAEAQLALPAGPHGFTVRRASLQDAFLALTGKRIPT